MSVLVINIIVNLQMKTLRVIGQTRYEDRGYSNEESIAYLQLQKPEEINSFHDLLARIMLWNMLLLAALFAFIAFLNRKDESYS